MTPVMPAGSATYAAGTRPPEFPMATQLDTFEQALAANTHVADVDAAVVNSARQLAKAIDDIVADPEASATEKTKALYLTPHLIAIYRELLMTPLARKAAGLAAADQKKASRLTLIQDQAKKTGTA